MNLQCCVDYIENWWIECKCCLEKSFLCKTAISHFWNILCNRDDYPMEKLHCWRCLRFVRWSYGRRYVLHVQEMSSWFGICSSSDRESCVRAIEISVAFCNCSFKSADSLHGQYVNAGLVIWSKASKEKEAEDMWWWRSKIHTHTHKSFGYTYMLLHIKL